MSLPRLPERDRRALDGRRRLSNTQMGVLLLLLVVVGTYLAFAKEIPFSGDGYTLNATFRNSVNIRADSPVRVAGVNVGKVISVRRQGNDATVTFTVDDQGRPVHEDAYVAIRPRIFFEGNFFLDLVAGEPGAPELPSGATIPISHTATAVQFDEVLSALREPQREELGKLLVEYGRSLSQKPSAKEDRGQDQEVKGKTGAQALNAAFDYGADAGSSTAQVTEAFQGTEPHDLSRLIAASARSFGAFVQEDERLQGLISNFNTTMGAFASEERRLARSVALLGPTVETARRSFTNLDRALPSLRRFALEVRPAVAELPPTIAAADPWLAAARPLLARRALGSVASSLERAMPGLAAAQATGYGALGQLSLLSLCTTNVLVPTGNQVLGGQFSTGQPNYREFFYATVGIAGESQGFDGNGPYLRIQAGGGDRLVHTFDPSPTPAIPTNAILYGTSFEPPIGTQPRLGPAPPKKPDARCHEQPIPDLNGPSGQVGTPSPRGP